MLYLAAVRHRDGSMSFLVETDPPEEWGDAITRSGANFDCVMLEERYLEPTDRPRDFRLLYAYAFARGFLRTQKQGEWEYPHTVPVLEREVECLHFVRRDLNLANRIVDESGSEQAAGYELANMRVFGETCAREGFPLQVTTAVA